MQTYVIGVDVGGTNLRMVAMNQAGALLAEHLESSARLLRASDPVEELAQVIDSFKNKILGTLAGVCIGFPGTVSKNKDKVYSCPNLIVFTDVHVGGPLTEKFGVPVYAEHDVILLMNYDISSLPLSEMSVIIGIYLGTGVGNAIWANGDFIFGADGVAGELGHVPVLGRKEQCPCGNRGCIELFTGGRQLQELAARRFPDTPFEELFLRHGEDEEILQYLDAVGTVIAIEVNILNPDLVILGGGVFQMPGFPMERVKAAVLRHTRGPYPRNNLKFMTASTEKFSGAIGAARYVWRQLDKR